ncbi:hypothetical protein EXVG_00103 [Emiliania huxleyi virus 202]|nr:hypothetical protein EXVG_00103 [Emiliania huxleyi virus 202]AHA54444.1 putative membrane protein [Emiliania huxleyi virus 18]AHA55485.1 putative membrane protein [Emiliania huxleyi virus 156]
MKTSTRYLIVAVVMCIFLCIVMYLFLDSSKPTPTPSGPCGKGGCSENTNVVPPPTPSDSTAMDHSMPPEPVVSETNMFTTPVQIPEDDESPPDIVDLDDLDDSAADDVPALGKALRAFGVPEFMVGPLTSKEDKVPPIVMTEDQYEELLETRKQAHAAIEEIEPPAEATEEDPAPDETPPSVPVTDEYASSDSDEAPPPPPTPEPIKKRRGRPPTKGIHGKKSQQVVDVLSGGKPPLGDIYEE